MPHEALDGLFPSFVRLVVAPVTDAPPCPFPEEHQAVAAAVARRQHEFGWGRACARAALEALGVAAVPIGVGAGRQPLWPPGVVGSIAHGGGWAGAAVAAGQDAWGIALDIEPLDPPLSLDVETLVHGAAERSAFSSSHPLKSHASKVAFCAKECVYKCLFPRTGWSLDFRDATVEVDMDARRFRAVLGDHHRLHGRPVAPLAGRFRLLDGLVLAGVVVPHSHDGVGRPGGASVDR